MKRELKRLQGRWAITSLELDGQPMPAGAYDGSAITVAGERFTTEAMGAQYEGSLEVDTTIKPHAIDMLFTAGPEAGNRSLGIYELDDDCWKLCLSLAGAGRPAQFVTTPGSGHALETLRRAPEVARSDTEEPEEGVETARVDPGSLDGEWAMLSGLRDGQALPEAYIQTGKRVARGGKTAVSFGGQLFLQANYRIDADQEPKAIDYVLAAGPNKGKLQHGIYELGAGMLTLCFSPPGHERPKSFTTSPGDGRTVSVWRFVKA